MLVSMDKYRAVSSARDEAQARVNFLEGIFLSLKGKLTKDDPSGLLPLLQQAEGWKDIKAEDAGKMEVFKAIQQKAAREIKKQDPPPAQATEKKPAETVEPAAAIAEDSTPEPTTIKPVTPQPAQEKKVQATVNPSAKITPQKEKPVIDNRSEAEKLNEFLSENATDLALSVYALKYGYQAGVRRKKELEENTYEKVNQFCQDNADNTSACIEKMKKR
jgi:hypothetical protein